MKGTVKSLLLKPVVHSKIVESQVKGSFTCPTITVPFTLNDKIKVPQTLSKHRRLVRLFLTPLTPGLSKPQTTTDIQTNMSIIMAASKLDMNRVEKIMSGM